MRGYPKDGYLAAVLQPMFSNLLKKRKMTLKDLARAAGVSRTHLTEFASGKKRITGETIDLLCKKFWWLREGGGTWWRVVTKDEWKNRDVEPKEVSFMAGPVLSLKVDKGAVDRYRTEQGLTLEALAKAAGVSLQTIYNIHAGRSKPRVTTAKALADALGVKVMDIFNIEEGATE